MKVESEKKYHVSNVIGQFLRKRRKELGLSCVTVAESIGISQQHLSRFENGRSVINVEMLFSVLRRLNVCFYEFYVNILLLAVDDKVLSKYISSSDVVNWHLGDLYYKYQAESIV